MNEGAQKNGRSDYYVDLVVICDSRRYHVLYLVLEVVNIKLVNANFEEDDHKMSLAVQGRFRYVISVLVLAFEQIILMQIG